MMVIVILGILVTVGLPSYRDSVARSVRTDAQSTLLGFSQAMERRFNQDYTYEGAAAGGDDTGVPDASVFASAAPLEGQPAYTLTIVAANDRGYQLRATPISGGRQANDGIIELDSLGRRSWDRNNDGSFQEAERNWDR
jgi:type IV pilus assembly protein PilE